VTVTTVQTGGDIDLTLESGVTLTFTADDWDVFQAVTVHAAEDADSQNGTATLVSSATGWTPATVTAGERDGERIIMVSPTAVTVPASNPAGKRLAQRRRH
jgi:hypothetical protein